MGYDEFSLDNLYYDIQGRVSVESWHVHGLTASTLEKKLFDRVIGRVEDILKERMSKYDVLFKLFNR